MTRTSTVLQSLDRTSCEALLANDSVGRLAVVVDGKPHVIPINYVAAGATIVFRTTSSATLIAACGPKVTFEVDRIHAKTRAGWSVCVHGTLREITNRADAWSRHLRDFVVDSWLAGPPERWFEIVPEVVTGRRLRPPR